MRQGIIAAVSTPPGKGGVAIIRMSGDGALALADRVFFPKFGRPLSSYEARRQVYGYIKDGEDVIDDGLATYFPKSSSYTGEETVEFSIHGGVMVTRRVLEFLFTSGAIPAEAGEFTRLAFINGRITLTEAEAIGDLLEAKSEEQLKLFSDSSRSRLRRRIDEIRESLTHLMGSVYARIDYPEEDLGELSDDEILEELTKTKESLAALISTYRTGRAIKEGISAALVGKPNAGKSTLYNLLVGEDAAIVTDIPGTTRDVLMREIPLGRVMLRLYDTAGVRASGEIDEVERIGISRTLDELSRAELALALFDMSRPLDSEDEEILSAISERNGASIAILTKCDIAMDSESFTKIRDRFDTVIEISSKNDPEGAIKLITEAVERLFTDEKISASADAIVASARQHSALSSALGAIESAITAFRLGIPADAASSDIELALASIGEVDGRAVSGDVVSDIFSRFCVGK